MNAKVLIAGTAVAVVAAGVSFAQSSKGSMSGNYAAPTDPIPYSQMDTYTAAKPKMTARHHSMKRTKSGMSSDPSMSGSSSMGSAGSDTSMSSGSMSSGSSPSGAMSGGSISSGSTSTETTPPVNSTTPPMTGATPPTTPPN